MKTLAAFVILAAAAGTSACVSQSDFDAHLVEFAALNTAELELRNHLIALNGWAAKIGKAVCNLERHTNPPNPGGDTRVCPAGGTDQSVPPPPPPPRT